MKKEDIQEQTKLMFDPYREDLEDVVDSNFDDKVLDKNNFL